MLALVGAVGVALGIVTELSFTVTAGALVGTIGVLMWASRRDSNGPPTTQNRTVSLGVQIGAGALATASLLGLWQYDQFIDTLESPEFVEDGEVLDEAATNVPCDDQPKLYLAGTALALAALVSASIALLSRRLSTNRWVSVGLLTLGAVAVIGWFQWDVTIGCYVGR